MAKAKVTDISQAPAPAPAAAAVERAVDGRPAHWRADMGGGFEGREALLGHAVNMAIKTLSQTTPHQNQINGAVVLATISALTFAKQNDMLEAYVEFDREMMRPITSGMGKLIAKTGNKELALEAVFDITECHYQLVLETKIEPGKRVWISPFKQNLASAVRIGQTDLTEEEIHERWTKPRLLAYAKDLGVEFRVSDLGADGTISCEVV
jgi:hypothetical protein